MSQTQTSPNLAPHLRRVLRRRVRPHLHLLELLLPSFTRTACNAAGGTAVLSLPAPAQALLPILFRVHHNAEECHHYPCDGFLGRL